LFSSNVLVVNIFPGVFSLLSFVLNLLYDVLLKVQNGSLYMINIDIGKWDSEVPVEKRLSKLILMKIRI